MRVILFVLLLCAAGIALARAGCETKADFEAKIATDAPGYDSLEVADLAGPDAQRLIAFWNRLPPSSAIAADQVVIYRGVDRKTGAEHPTWVVILLAGGCVVDRGGVPSFVLRDKVPAA